MAYALVAQSDSPTGTNVISYTVTPGANNGAVIVYSWNDSGSTPFTVSTLKNQAGTNIPFTLAGGAGYSTGSYGFGQGVIWVPSFPAGTTQIVMTLSGTPSGSSGFNYREYSGLTKSLTIDAYSVNQAQTAPSGTDGVTSNTATPTGAANGAMVFGFVGSYSAYEYCTAGTGFGNFDVSYACTEGACEDKRITSNAAVAATFQAATVGNLYTTQMLVIDELGAATQPPEDSFSHFELVEFDDDTWAFLTEQVGSNAAASMPVEDSWIWDEIDDDEWITRDTDSNSSALLSSQYFGDDAERYEDVDDDWPLDEYLNDAAQPPEDPWNHFEDADEDSYDEGLIGADNNSQLSPSDGYDFFSQDEDDWYEGTDQAIADNNAFLSLEDAWPHFGDDDALDDTPLDETNVGLGATTQYYGEDAELLDSDLVDDDEWVARDSDSVGPDLASVSVDEWDWSQDDDDWYSDDYSNLNLVVNAQYYGEDAENADVDFDDDFWIAAIEPIGPNPTIVNAQYYGEDAEIADVDFDDDEWTTRDTDVVGPNNIQPPPFDDAWDWSQDDDDQTPIDERASDTIAPALIDDSWQWEDGDDDLYLDDYLNDAAQPPEDAWHHFEDDGDDFLIFDQHSLGAAAERYEDPWFHFDDELSDSIDEFLEWQSISANPVLPSQFTDDSWWFWTDEFLDDYEAVGFDYAIIGAAVNPKPTQLTVKCAATKLTVSTATTQLIVTTYDPNLGAF